MINHLRKHTVWLNVSMMPQIQHMGRPESCQRELFSLALPDFQSLPDSLSFPTRHFIAFVAADSTGVDAAVLAEFSRKLLRAGCVYLCCWGEACDRVHDIFDEECFDIVPLIITTSHLTDSLDEALWFFVFNVYPYEDYWDTSATALAISIGRPDWHAHIRQRLGDLESLTNDVVQDF